LFNFLELIEFIMEHRLTLSVAQTIGIGKPYTALREAYKRLEEIVKRNPVVVTKIAVPAAP
jgi:phosphate starvation-inducible protein PhoH